MQQFLESSRSVLLLGALGLMGLGLVAGFGGAPEAARAQTKDDKKAPAKIVVSPPPADVNDLSMEVAALRTLYLLKAAADQTDHPGTYAGIKSSLKDCAQKPRQRQVAKVSKNYRQVLAELRAAFIVNQASRINELSEQLDELTKDEQPELDDAVEITDQARKNAPRLLNWFDANRIAGYIAAYGKDFPDPWVLMYKATRLDGKGTKPTPEQWKETRAFVIREVGWQVGGLDLNRQQKVGEEVADLLDRAYALSEEELKRQGKAGGGLRGELAKICKPAASPTDVIKHVLEQDVAEILSNPRLLPAMEAREQYLKKVGITP